MPIILICTSDFPSGLVALIKEMLNKLLHVILFCKKNMERALAELLKDLFRWISWKKQEIRCSLQLICQFINFQVHLNPR